MAGGDRQGHPGAKSLYGAANARNKGLLKTKDLTESSQTETKERT